MVANAGTVFPIGVFVGNPNGNDVAANARFEADFDAFRSLMGASPQFMNAFTDFGQDPSQWVSNAAWTAWSWSKTGARYVGPGSGVEPVIGVPLASNAGGWGSVDAFYKAIVSGAYDTSYRGIVSAWAAEGYSKLQMRLGYEFNGSFMPWAPGNSGSAAADADFVAAWQHVADLVHDQGKASGIAVQTVWNPTDISWTNVPTAQLYPGDGYVDVIGTDTYSPTYTADLADWSTGGTTQMASPTQWAAIPANRQHYWQYTDGSQWVPTGTGSGWSMQDAIDMAVAHGKPLTIAETGAGNDGAGTGPVDDPAFPAWLAGALAQAAARGVTIENVDIWATDQSDGAWGFLNGEKPLEAAAWAKAFGAGSGTAGVGAPEVPSSGVNAQLPVTKQTFAPEASDVLFDASYYLSHNPDVAAAGLDPLQHYLEYGASEGRDPNAFVDTGYYLRQNPDVAAAGLNPLQHFEQYGWREGRQPSLVFDGGKYLQANPDVKAAGIDPLQHYLDYGESEGRATFLTGGLMPADPLVNAAYYDQQLGVSLIDAGVGGSEQAAWLYDSSGWAKGLNPDALFDTGYYLSNNPDVAAADINPLLHYETYGWKEGRDPSAQFSTAKYLAAYSDVKTAGMDPLVHWVVYGQAEGRGALAV